MKKTLIQNAVYNCKQSASENYQRTYKLCLHNKAIRSKVQHDSSEKVNRADESYRVNSSSQSNHVTS